MDFTREPIIETVITPKEGCKLVVRSSKATGQEEYFVDAVEVVSFGSSFFFRSLEKPKAFLVPATDYEILEVREARMVLKNVGLDRSIKIGGGRESKPIKEAVQEKVEQLVESAQGTAEPAVDGRLDKKRDRRKHYRRRRGRDEAKEGSEEIQTVSEGEFKIDLSETKATESLEDEKIDMPNVAPVLSSLLPPPSTLISETISRYRDNAMFRGAFFLKDEERQEGEEEQDGEENEASEKSDELGSERPSPIPPEGYLEDTEVAPKLSLNQPESGSFEVTEEEEEAIYQQRMRTRFPEDESSTEPQFPEESQDVPESQQEQGK